jgi:hypothetical protein
MMNALISSETSVLTRATRHNITEDTILVKANLLESESHLGHMGPVKWGREMVAVKEGTAHTAETIERRA